MAFFVKDTPEGGACVKLESLNLTHVSFWWFLYGFLINTKPKQTTSEFGIAFSCNYRMRYLLWILWVTICISCKKEQALPDITPSDLPTTELTPGLPAGHTAI